MKTHAMVFVPGALAVLLLVDAGGDALQRAPGPEPAFPSRRGEAGAGPELFLDAASQGAVPRDPRVLRSRHARINLAALFDELGRPREGGALMLNFFPDANHAAELEGSVTEGDTISWTGRLRDELPGEITMVYTAGVLVGSFAAPEGIYEASAVSGGLYRVILIDRTRLPGGDESTEPRSPRH